MRRPPRTSREALVSEILADKIERIKADRGPWRRADDIAMSAATVAGMGSLLTAPVAFPVATVANWGDGTENIIPDVLREGSQASLIGGGTVLGGVTTAALLRRMRQRR